MGKKYDSTKDTLEHIRQVRLLLTQVVEEVMKRGDKHDDSKLHAPEKVSYDEVVPQLKTLTYGSKEYRDTLKEMKGAIKHHYDNNRHHPEHFKGGVKDMTLIDIMEMLADWKAATLRHMDGDLGTSLTQNVKRFKLSPQLASILENTVKALGWGKKVK
jgi:hypothetical protein